MNRLRHLVLPWVALSLLPVLVSAQNDKQVLGDAVLTPSEIEEGATVTYLIRFQNPGPDTVYQVIIRDTLDARLDASTFEMQGSSHSYQLVRDLSNIIRWYFDDIYLPDSSEGGANSVGFILFTVKPKPFLAPGQTILNHACITFDQIETVCTNSAIVWIDEDADVGEPEKESKLRIIPNPNRGEFEVRNDALATLPGPDLPPAEWWISDMTGKVIWDGRAENMAAAGNQVLMERPSPGLYLLWVKDEDGLQVEEFAILH
ncbi:MAG: hypothetical protein IT260_05780 [Saprospiraceae bacterium]|nr:hypothetical protein [Saprospiraceae bacterium]